MVDGDATGAITYTRTAAGGQVTITTGCNSSIIEIHDWSTGLTGSCTAASWGMSWGTTGNCSSGGRSITDWEFRQPSATEQRAWRRKEAARRKKQRAASKRARELLRRFLTERQLADFDKHGHFFMQTPKGHRYKIGSARDHNVVRLNRRGKPMRVFCASIYGVRVPLEDVLLAQLLMLQADEDGFVRVANHWALRTARGFPAKVPRAA